MKLKSLNEFIVPFIGLKAGQHEFSYNIKDEFFEKFDYSEFNDADIRINLTLTKETNHLYLNFAINGYVNVNCDRCLGAINMPVKGIEELVIKFKNTDDDDDENIVVLSPTEHEIDISHYIFEYVNLMIPVKKVHSGEIGTSEGCDKKIIEIMNELSDKKPIDPRWDKLKDLK